MGAQAKKPSVGGEGILSVTTQWPFVIVIVNSNEATLQQLQKVQAILRKLYTVC